MVGEEFSDHRGIRVGWSYATRADRRLSDPVGGPHGAAFNDVSLLPVFTRDVLHKGPIELGLLSTATGIGSFLGLLTLNFLRQRVRVTTLFVVGTGWMCVALAVFAVSIERPATSAPGVLAMRCEVAALLRDWMLMI